MSIALDLMLFLREHNQIDKNGKIVKINASVRGLLATLMFRLGSNATSWVTQDELANEMGMSLDGLHKLITKSLKTGLIIKSPNPKNKRQNQYSAAKFLIDYHITRRDKLSVDNLKLPKNYTPKKAYIDTEYTPKKAYINSNTRQKRRISRNTDALEQAPDVGCQDDAMPLKEKEKQINNKSKVKRKIGSKNLTSYPHDFFPDEKRRELLDKTVVRTKRTHDYLLRRFEEISKEYETCSKDWQKTFEKFLLKEFPKRSYDSDNKDLTSINQNLKSYVGINQVSKWLA